MRTIRVILAATVAVLALSSCNLLIGSGTIEQVTYNLNGFDRININDAFTATVVQGPSFSVECYADSVFVPYLDVQVIGDTLNVGIKEGYSISTFVPNRVVITMPSLTGVTLNGASTLSLSDFTTSPIALSINGASTLHCNNMTMGALSLNIDGASTLTRNNATFQSAQVSVNGASSATISIISSLSGTVNGASTLNYHCSGSVSLTKDVASSINAQ